MLRCCGLGLVLWLVAWPALAGEVQGLVSLDVEGIPLDRVGPIVVYLDGAPGQPSTRLLEQAEVRQREVSFQPAFLVVSIGQPVAMPNDDQIFHNVFSRSLGNAFDLGTYAAGRSKTIRFERPGLVRLYCSIHEGMSGGIFVSPTPWFAQASAKGHYRIVDVPPGRYELTVWNERLSGTTRHIVVPAEGTKRVDLRIGATTQ
jgi:plastocyanin